MSTSLQPHGRQASLSITNSWSLLKLMSIESVISSNHFILCHPFSFCLQSFLASGSFPMSQLFTSGGRSIGASASASVLPMNIQKTLRVSSSTTVQSINSLALNFLYSDHRTGKGQFSFQFQRKAIPKNVQTTAQLHSSHTLAK